MDDADLQDQNKLFEKMLSSTDVKNPMVVPMDALGLFQIREGEHEMLLQATDRVGQQWNFRLFTRRCGHPKPTLGGEGWPSFPKEKGLKAGDKIEMYRIQREGVAVTYEIRASRKIFKVWAPIL